MFHLILLLSPDVPARPRRAVAQQQEEAAIGQRLSAPPTLHLPHTQPQERRLRVSTHHHHTATTSYKHTHTLPELSNFNANCANRLTVSNLIPKTEEFEIKVILKCEVALSILNISVNEYYNANTEVKTKAVTVHSECLHTAQFHQAQMKSMAVA